MQRVAGAAGDVVVLAGREFDYAREWRFVGPEEEPVQLSIFRATIQPTIQSTEDEMTSLGAGACDAGLQHDPGGRAACRRGRGRGP